MTWPSQESADGRVEAGSHGAFTPNAQTRKGAAKSTTRSLGPVFDLQRSVSGDGHEAVRPGSGESELSSYNGFAVLRNLQKIIKILAVLDVTVMSDSTNRTNERKFEFELVVVAPVAWAISRNCHWLLVVTVLKGRKT